MTVYKSWQEFMTYGDKELQETVLKFSSMEKGKLFYKGRVNPKVPLEGYIECEVTESYIGGYYFDYEESISKLSQSSTVRLTIDGELIIYIE